MSKDDRIAEIKSIFDFMSQNGIDLWNDSSINGFLVWIARVLEAKEQRYRIHLLWKAGMPMNIRIPVQVM